MSTETADRMFPNSEHDEDKGLIEPIVEIASTSMQKVEITVAKRLEILQKLEEGVAIDKLCMEYGLHRRTIQRYRKNVESLRKMSQHPRCLAIKRYRLPVHEDINTRLHEWILQRQAEGDAFTDSLLQEKAKELHKTLGGTTSFTASRGWLWRFKKRYSINVKNNQEDSFSVNDIIEAKFSTNDLTTEKCSVNDLSAEILATILKGENIEVENVYNIHETCLMWRNLPQTILSREEESIKNRIKREYITLAFCSNATGTHKLPILFINKYPNPRALKHCRQLLPVVYTNQNNSCLDEIVFNDWYVNHFKPNVRQHQHQKQRVGKVLLIVDPFKSNMLFEKEQEDLHFKLITLSSDTHSIVQPMEEGIIRKCKKLYRQKLVCRVHQYDGGIKEFYVDYDIKDCIDLISETWDEITMMDIKYSWRKLLRQDFKFIIKEEPGTIGESIFSREITEWIVQCDEEEKSVIGKNSNNANTDLCHPIEEEEIDRIFHILEIWAKRKPDFIKLHVKQLIQYYNR